MEKRIQGFFRGIRNLFKKPAPKAGSLSVLEAYQKQQIPIAQIAGWNNESDCNKITAQFIAKANQSKTEALTELNQQKADAQVSETLAKQAVDGFDKAKRVEQICEQNTPQMQEEKAETSSKKEAVEHKLYECQQKKAEILKKADKWKIDLYPTTIKKVGAFFLIPLVMVMFVDIPVTGPALISMGVPPLIAWISAIPVSAFIALTAHFLAEQISQNSRFGVISWLIVGLGLLACVIGVRLGEDPFIYITGSLIVFCYMGGVLCSLNHYRKKIRVDLPKDWESVNEKERELIQQSDKLKQPDGVLVDTYRAKATEQASEEEALLTRNHNSIIKELGSIESKIQKTETMYTDQTTIGVHALETAFHKARNQVYTRGSKRSDFSANGAKTTLLLLVMATVISSCDTSETMYYGSVVADHTDYSGLAADKNISGIHDYMLYDFANLDESFSGRRAVRFDYWKIGTPSIPESKSFSLPSGEPELLRNVPARDSTVKAFCERVERLGTQILTEKVDMSYSNVHRGTAFALNALASSGSQHMACVIITDCIEHSFLCNLTRHAHSPKEIREKQQEYIDIFLKDTPLKPLQGIHIKLLCQNEHDELSYYASELFSVMWTAAGADVEIVNNL